jgi:hypothetical protein
LLIVAGLDDLFRRNGVAWPVILIAAGSFLLYNNLGPQSWISWTQLFRLWPILLIAVGVDIIFRNQSGWVIFGGVLLTVALIAGVVWMFSESTQIDAGYTQISEEFTSGIKSAELDVSLGFGEVILRGQDTANLLIEGNISPDEFETESRRLGNSIQYEISNEYPEIFPYSARWELAINQQLDVEISVHNGVGEAALTLDSVDVDRLRVNQAVGRLVISLPEEIKEEVLVKQAVGAILIQIPPDVRIAVDAQNGLTKIDFPDGFELEDGYYTSPGATKANADLVVIVEQAIGLVTIQYSR